MMMAMWHSNGQLSTERDGDTEKGCQTPAVGQKTTELNYRQMDEPGFEPQSFCCPS